MLITNDIDKFLYADGAESLPGIEEAKQMTEDEPKPEWVEEEDGDIKVEYVQEMPSD